MPALNVIAYRCDLFRACWWAAGVVLVMEYDDWHDEVWYLCSWMNVCCNSSWEISGKGTIKLQTLQLLSSIESEAYATYSDDI